MKWKSCLEDGLAEDSAGSAGVEASATPTPSADGFHGCLDGGGHTPPSTYRTTAPLGAYRIWVTGAAHTLGPMDIRHMQHITELSLPFLDGG